MHLEKTLKHGNPRGNPKNAPRCLANDGLVAVSSALWERARHKGIWKDADHLNELAWWDFAQAGTEGFLSLTKRIHAKYLEIARELPGISYLK